MKLYAKQRILFPDPKGALYDGIVAVSEELSTELLFEAYSFGIFPWPHEGYETLWFCPERRGVIDFKRLHIPTSFKKFLRNTNLKITFNTHFDEVIDECSRAPRAGEATWINSLILSAYKKFHKMGYAHSVECWDEGQLVGGLYGVYVAGNFSGESMFFKRDNASKLCLYSLILRLKEKGLEYLDVQMITPVSKSFGGTYISRDEFLKRLDNGKKRPALSFI